MTSVALIAIAAIPAMYTVVGIVLIVLALTSTALFVWKLREANTLRKEVMELRDTMRMMRYEEANLARMLHTADKTMPKMEEIATEPTEIDSEETVDATEAIGAAKLVENIDSTEPTEEEAEIITEEATGERTEEAVESDTENVEEPTRMVAEEPIVENHVTETVEEYIVENHVTEMVEDSIAEVHVTEAGEETTEATTEKPIAEPIEDITPLPIARSRRQTIKERCPAIPNDLFAAWFEENDNATEPDEEPEAEPAKENIPNQPTTVQESPIEESTPQESPNASDSTETPKRPMSREDERFCHKLERTIQTRMRNPNLNVDIIASQFGLGRTNFYRKVRELTGMSPNDYLRKCRMTKAGELLQNTELSISDVCVQVGIPDAQYFSRVFKAHYGVTPSLYREQ